MPNEGWRDLVEKNWGNYVILHNFPNFNIYENKSVKTINSKISIYEIQKSAIKWNPSEFFYKK